jgi:CHAT domain-containing protein
VSPTGIELRLLADCSGTPYEHSFQQSSILSGCARRIGFARCRSAPDRILLEEYATAVVPHGPFLATALALNDRSRPSKQDVLVLGGVDYDHAPAIVPGSVVAARLAPATDDQRKGVSALPGTLREMRRVAALAEADLKAGTLTLSGSRADVASVLAALPKVRYAHLATHGFFANASMRSALHVAEQNFRQLDRERGTAGARNPLVLSGIVLAGANRTDAGADRGILTAEGIVGLNLEGMDLAVLSACETGLGEVAGGEGAMGLVRAFHVAGAKEVVASLWAVEDNSTAALMVRFYHHLWAEKRPPLDAFRQAQLDIYRNPDQIGKWSTREIDFDEKSLPKVVPQAKESAPANRAKTRQWAAFLLSGAGR